MKRLLPMLVFCLARLAAAQAAPPAQTAEPVPEPQNVNVKRDGRCVTVRPGDTVHYSLTIEGVADAHAVFGDLRLRFGHTHEITRGELPVPDFRSLGGGGLGTRDTGDAKLFHFAFKVPKEIYGGVYRGVEVNVHPDEILPVSRITGVHASHVDVTRQTRNEVHAYCLNVMSKFGMEPGVPRPAVTSFQPGQVDPPPPTPLPPTPTPLPR